jgi:hypothetical protein
MSNSHSTNSGNPIEPVLSRSLVSDIKCCSLSILVSIYARFYPCTHICTHPCTHICTHTYILIGPVLWRSMASNMKCSNLSNDSLPRSAPISRSAPANSFLVNRPTGAMLKECRRLNNSKASSSSCSNAVPHFRTWWVHVRVCVCVVLCVFICVRTYQYV